MADLRLRHPIKIVDPTTDANEAGVSAAGDLQVELGVAIPAGTNNIGDVDIASALPAGNNNIGNVDIATAIPAGTNNIGDVDVASGPTGTSALEMQGTAADGAAAVGDPIQAGGVDGSGNIQRLLTDTDGHLQIDVLSGGGVDTPSNEVVHTVTSAAVAAGASADLDTSTLDGLTRKLSQVDLAASVPWKAVINQVDDDVDTAITVLFGEANKTTIWKPPHRDYCEVTFGSNGGLDGFQVRMTNLDNSQAADLYATLYTES